MSTQRLLFVALLTVTSVACAGRKAAWQRDEHGGKTGGSSDVATLITEGDAHWAKRADPKEIRAAIAAWQQVVDANPKHLEALIRLTRGNYFLADGYLRDNEKEYLRTMDVAVKWGEKAVLASSAEFEAKMRSGTKFPQAVKLVGKDGIPAMYWYASALGKWAKRKGFAVLVGQKDNVKATMDRVLELDPNYFYGGPHRYFGAMYAVAPAFAGGDLEKSRTHFKKSIEIAADYVGTKVLWAQELAVKEQDEATFDKLLAEVLATPDDAIPDVKPEIAVEKQKARELIEQKDELF